MLHESKYFRIGEGEDESEETILMFECPGCECHHYINSTWQLTFADGKPTVSPSILVNHGKYMDKENPETSYVPIRCHSFIRNGKIEFLSDCTHKLAGKTVDMIILD